MESGQSSIHMCNYFKIEGGQNIQESFQGYETASQMQTF